MLKYLFLLLIALFVSSGAGAVPSDMSERQTVTFVVS